MKRHQFFALLLCLVLVISLIPTVAFAQETPVIRETTSQESVDSAIENFEPFSTVLIQDRWFHRTTYSVTVRPAANRNLTVIGFVDGNITVALPLVITVRREGSNAIIGSTSINFTNAVFNRVVLPNLATRGGNYIVTFSFPPNTIGRAMFSIHQTQFN